jgi:catechol 2,3-dioxygenase-like lactoylglutathione lyase family enzyme
MFTPLGLDHVVLRVRDQAASQRFHTEVLGCSVDHVNEKVSLIQLRFGEQLTPPWAGNPEAGVRIPLGPPFRFRFR